MKNVSCAVLWGVCVKHGFFSDPLSEVFAVGGHLTITAAKKERNSFQTLRLIKINFKLMMLVASQRMQKIFTPFKMAVDKQRLYGTHEHFIKIIMVWVQFNNVCKEFLLRSIIILSETQKYRIIDNKMVANIMNSVFF